MKVLVVTPFPPTPTGEADHALHLCEHLAQAGWEVHVVTTTGSVTPTSMRLEVSPIMRDWTWDDLQLLLTTTKASSPDAVLLVYLHHVYNWHPMIRFFPTLAKALLPRSPFVTVFEGASGFNHALNPFRVELRRGELRDVFGPGDSRFTYGNLLRDSDRVIAVSKRVQAALEPYCPGLDRKSEVIPSPPILRIAPENGGETRRQRRQEMGLGPDDWLIANFGYIYPSKGVETLMHAFRLLAARRGNARLMLVGGVASSRVFGPDYPRYVEQLLHMPRAMGLEHKVRWTGPYRWDSDEASRYLRAADCAVLPFDGGACLHNSSLAAAVAHGLPLVTTRGSDTESAFIHEKNALLCHPRSPGALATAVESLMDHPEHRQHLRAGALELADEWFSWSRHVERTAAALSQPCPPWPDLDVQVHWAPA